MLKQKESKGNLDSFERGDSESLRKRVIFTQEYLNRPKLTLSEIKRGHLRESDKFELSLINEGFYEDKLSKKFNIEVGDEITTVGMEKYLVLGTVFSKHKYALLDLKKERIICYMYSLEPPMYTGTISTWRDTLKETLGIEEYKKKILMVNKKRK